MRKKTLLWLVSFAILICLNLFITFKYIGKVERRNASLLILEEIDRAGKSSSGLTAGASEESLSALHVANLKQFFRDHNSPLYDHAEFIVKTSEKYEFDYRLLPAIAMQESTLCRNIPKDSHNCWGWGIYGNTVTRFSTYDEAIAAVGKGLKEQYIDKGLTTTSDIMAKYTPSSDGSWARSINNFMKALE